MSTEYQLSCELVGHTEDVRGLAISDSGIITGSRDKTVKLWRQQGPHRYEEQLTLVGHTDFVVPVAYVPAGRPQGPDKPAIVSGSRDTTVIVWDLDSAQPLQTLKGHKYQVTGLAVGDNGEIYSSSLDSTIRVWRHGKCEAVLEGHEGPVQCVLMLPNGDLLSGSGDRTIRQWSGGKCVHTYTGHTDTVRDLALFPEVGVVSASHDQTLRVWTFGGDVLAELVGHTALVYACAATPGGLVASGSEDNTVRLWQAADGMCLQTIEHPGCVWDVAFLPNNDLVSACSDFFARVWTPDPERQAPAELVQSLAASVAAKKQADKAREEGASGSGGGGGGGGGGLPAGLTLEDASVLTQPGQRDGQTKVVREGGAGVAYCWSAARGEWEKIGEVVGGPSGDTVGVGGKWHAGRQWDYVFDVDVEDGAPPRKLALNRGDNPYDVADRFMEAENLPTTYREQIVNWVVQNTGGAVALPPIPSMNVDPFTGGGAYIPSGPSPAALRAASAPIPVTAASTSNPFFGGGAYVPSSPPPAHVPSAPSSAPSTAGFSVTGGGADPFTGGAPRRLGSGTQPHIPRSEYFLFDSAPNVEAMARKIREFSNALASDPDTQGLALPEKALASGGHLEGLLNRAVALPASHTGSNALTQGDLELVEAMLAWPPAQLFPALDLARLLLLEPNAAAHLAQTAGRLDASHQGGALGPALMRATSQPAVAANLQTGLRAVCNAFRHAPALEWVQANRAELLDAFAPCCSSGSKGVRLGLASLAGNLAVLDAGTLRGGADAGVSAQALSCLLELLACCPADDTEALYRALVALGTFVSGNLANASLARDLDATHTLQAVQDKVDQAAGAKVLEAAREVDALLSA